MEATFTAASTIGSIKACIMPTGGSCNKATVTNPHTFSNLDGSTEYTVKAVAVYESITSVEASSSATFTDPSMPSMTLVQAATSIQATFIPESNTNSYKSCIYKSGDTACTPAAETSPKLYDSLDPSTRYTIKLIAVFNTVESSEYEDIEADTAPESPSILITQQLFDKITIYLLPSTTATEYFACIFKTNEAECQLSTITQTYTFTNLDASNSYEIKYVSAFNTANSSSSTEPTVYTAPSVPTITITQSLSTSIKVTFTETSTTSAFKLCIYLASGSSCTLATESSPKTFSGLTPSSEYIIHIVAVFQSLESELFDKTDVFTAPTVPTMAVTSQLYNQFTVTFTEASDTTSYKACSFATTDSDCTLVPVSNPETFTSLAASSEYKVKYSAVYETVESVATESTVIYTAPSVPSLTVTEQLSNSITVEFTETSTTTTFKVCIYATGTSTCTPAEAVSPKTFSSLQPSTSYNIKVEAVHNLLSSESFEKTDVFTAPSNPTIAINEQLNDRVTVQFTQGSLTTSYKACIYETTRTPCTLVPISNPETFTSLSASTEHIIRYAAVHQAIESSIDTESSVYTAPASPTMDVTSQLFNTITVGFTAVSTTSEFKACIYKLGESPCSMVTVTSSKTFPGLDASTGYAIRLIGINSGLESAEVTNNGVYTAPLVPTVTIQDQFAESITVIFIQGSTTSNYKACIYVSTISECTLDAVSNPATFNGLAASTSYTLRFAATYESVDSTISDQTPIYTAPSAPTMSVTSQLYNSIAIEFEQSSDSTSFKVCIYEAEDSECTPNTENSPKTFSSLTPSTNHFVKLIAVFQNLESVLVTNNMYTAPLAPTITVENQVFDQIRVHFIHLSATTSYKSCSYETGTTACIPEDVANPVTFESLTASKSYNVRVIAIYKSIESEMDEKTAVYTAPAKPTMTITTQLYDRIVVTFSENSETTEFKICIHETGNDICAPTVAESPKTFLSLSASTEHTIKLVAVFQSLESVENEDTSVFTAPKSPTISVTTQLFDNIRVAFTENSPTTSYEACIYKTGESECTPSAVSNPETFSSLTASTSYVVKYMAVYQSLRSVETEERDLYTAPSAPSVNIDNQSKDVIEISFQPSSTTSTFEICYYLTGSGSCNFNQAISPQTFSALTPSEDYTIKVVAINENLRSTETIKSPTYTAPDTTIITHSSRTDTSVEVSYVSATTADNYDVCIYLSSGARSCTYSSEVSPHTFSSLLPGEDYIIEVQASFQSVDGELATLADHTAPDITAITIINFNTTLINITFGVESGNVDSYEGEIYLTSATADAKTTMSSPHDWTNLIPGEQYAMEIHAVYKGTAGAVASAIQCTMPETPNAVSVSEFSWNNITFNWTQPSAGVFDDFIISLTPTAGASWPINGVTDGEIPYTIENLNEATSYTLEVKANSHGCLSLPQEITHKTKWLIEIETVQTELRISESLDTSIDQLLITMIMDVNNLAQWRLSQQTPEGYFKIGLASGELFLAANSNIDFEHLADNPMTVIVEGYDVEPYVPDFHKLSIIVENVNDENPTWINLPASISVNENSKSDVIFTLIATDPDNDETISPLSFRLEGAENQFELVNANVNGTEVIPSFSSPNFSAELRIRWNAMLNHEVKSVYVLQLIASDGVNQEAIGELTVNILDLFDVHPNIINLNRTISIEENQHYPENTLLYSVEMENLEGDDVIFKIESATDNQGNNASSKFEINTDGKIYITANSVFDFEDLPPMPIYHLTISVTNIRNHTLLDVGFLEVNVTDVNESPFFVASSPQFLFEIKEDNDLTSEVKTTSVENSLLPTGKTNIDLRTQDPDAPDSSSENYHVDSIVYNLISQTVDGVFELAPPCSVPQSLNSAGVTTANCTLLFSPAKLDSEVIQTEKIDVKIQAVDSKGLTAEMLLQFKVINMNDNYPVFSRALYEASVAENSVRDTFVVQVSATDADYNDESGLQELFYHIPDTEKSVFFNINSETGIITVKYPFDREIVGNWLNFTVEAIDNGTVDDSTKLKVFSSVAINVLDQNDVRPFLLVSFYSTEMPFNVSNDYFTKIQIAAQESTYPDLSGTDNSQIRYRLARESTYFKINSTDGRIYKRNESLSVYQEYDVFVQAFDLGSPELSSGVGLVRIDTYDQTENTLTCSISHPLSWMTEQRELTLTADLNNQWPDWQFRIESSTSTGNSSMDLHFYAFSYGDNRIKEFVKASVLFWSLVPSGLHSTFTSGNLTEYAFQSCTSPPESDSNLIIYGVIAGSVVTVASVGTVIAVGIAITVKFIGGKAVASAVTPMS